MLQRPIGSYHRSAMCRFSSLSALFFVTCALFAQTASRSSSLDAGVIWDPPAWPFLQKSPKPTVSKEMVAALHVSDFPVILEKTKMEDVESTLGGTIGQRGDAGNFDEWLCFYGADSGGRWALWLESGEINGGTVGSFQWRRLNENAVLDGRCRMLGEAKVELQNKLRLGLTEAEALKILGPPKARR